MARILSFAPEQHEYQLDGEILPSVSELTRFLTRETYSDVSQYTLDRAADRGTTVHKATEALDKFGEVEVDDEYLPYLEAYISFRREHNVRWDRIEYASYNAEYRYAGTIDRMGTVDGKKALLDIKTTSTIHKPLVTTQLALYRMMLESQGDGPETQYVLQLKKDGKYRLLELPFRDDLAKAYILLHNELKTKKRKKED